MEINILGRSFTTILLLFLGVTTGRAQSPIDTTLIRLIDLTDDNRNDTMYFHLEAQTFASPFRWTLDIRSQQGPIFFQTGDDSTNDGFFSDTNYVGNCLDYHDCKRKWYYHDWLDLLIDRSDRGDYFVPDLAREYLRDSCRITGLRAEEIIARARMRLKSGPINLINFEPGPGYGPLWLYIAELRRFIPDWDD